MRPTEHGVLTDPRHQASGRCDLKSDAQQHRERQEAKPAAVAGEEADPRADAEQPAAPIPAHRPKRSADSGGDCRRAVRTRRPARTSRAARRQGEDLSRQGGMGLVRHEDERRSKGDHNQQDEQVMRAS
jgi:hypothetical protein